VVAATSDLTGARRPPPCVRYS